MTLILDTVNAPENNSFNAKIGCGLVYCLSEDEYETTAGVKSFIPIIFNLLAAISDGDTMNLHGVVFTFVSGAPTDASEIQINGVNTAANVLVALQTYPFFADNYDITQPNQFELYIENKYAEIDYNYFFEVNTANTDAILINPVYPSASIQAGFDAVVKQDYTVQLDIFDVLDSNNKLCSSSFAKPLNVFSDGNNKVCFDVQKIIEDYNNIYTSPPAPLPDSSSGVQTWDWYEPNFLGQFRMRFTSSYRSSDSVDCADRVIGDVITYPTSLGLRLYVVNIIEEPDGAYTALDFSYFGAPSLPILPITIHPEDYKLCADTAWEWRVDFPVDLIQNVLGGIAMMTLTYTYTDGTTDIHNLDFSTDFDGVQIISMNLGNTIPASNPAKVLDSVKADIYESILAQPLVLVSTKTWYFETPNSDKCCKCHKQFYFLSKLGNNETIISSCDTSINFEVEMFESCKEVTCGGTDFLDTAVFSGGNVPINVSSRAKLHTVVIECNNEEYLQAFLESPVKYIYEDSKLYRIQQTATSYQIYQVNENRFLLEYQYKKSIDVVRRHFSV